MSDNPEVRFRPARSDDETMIRRWLVRPHVARWAHRHFTTISENFLDALLTPDEEFHIVEFGDRPIGCAHIYPAMREDSWEAIGDVTEATRAIDFLIGEADVVNKKVGQKMLRALSGWIFRDPAIDRIVVCLHPDNWPAIIALKRVGFREKGRHPEPKMNAMYLTITPASLKADVPQGQDT